MPEEKKGSEMAKVVTEIDMLMRDYNETLGMSAEEVKRRKLKSMRAEIGMSARRLDKVSK